MVLPFDETDIITRTKRFNLYEHFAGQPAYYVRLEVDSDCALYIGLMNGSTFQYSRGVRTSLPAELTNYTIKYLVLVPSGSTRYYIHATTLDQPDCTPEDEKP